MGRSRYHFDNTKAPHFMTCTILNWLPVFTRQESVDIIFDSLRFLMKDGMNVYAYVILENHLHLIADSKDLSRDISRFKSFTARQIIAWLKEQNAWRLLDQFAFYKKTHKTDRTYQIWQEGVHPEFIHSDEMMREKIRYIHYNPVKRGYVDKPEHWRYSSARNYSGLEGLLDVSRTW